MVTIFRCETPLGAIASFACGPVDIPSGERGEIPDVVGTEAIGFDDRPSVWGWLVGVRAVDGVVGFDVAAPVAQRAGHHASVRLLLGN
jgi:hypothetical protein